MKRLSRLKLAVLFAALCVILGAVLSCGAPDDITAGQVEAMTDDEALALLDCQLRLAADDMGQDEAVDYSVNLMEEGVDSGDLTAIQVTLWNKDGYRCPELLP